jgi:hypothetical protein
MNRDELCGHIQQILHELQLAFECRDWTTVDRAFGRLSDLNHQLWKADDFTIETGIGR